MKMKITYTDTLITPDMAATLLLDTKGNTRSVNSRTVSIYAKDLASGYWKGGTAEAIKLSPTGSVLDGQHRLMAIVKSGVSMDAVIARGIGYEVFDVIDTGKVRSACDIFRIAGVKNESIVPAIITSHINLKNLYSKRMKDVPVLERSTNKILLDIYMGNKEFWQNNAAKSLLWHKEFAKILRPTTIGALYALFSEIDPVDADLFMEQMSTGLNFTNLVIATLRTKLIYDKNCVRKMDMITRHALIIKAWNVFRKGGTVNRLLVDPRDSFPVAI